jgi:hypothetical protein
MAEKHSSESTESLAGFDSGTTMLASLKHSLRAEPFAGVLPVRYVPARLLQSVNVLPNDVRQWIYRAAGAEDALHRKLLDQVNMEHIAEQIVEGFPDRRFPAIAIGSANGALVHLCAALGIPWLPQTLLITAKRSVHPDDVAADAEWGRESLDGFLANNPGVVVHQMHDPVQDRLMVSKVGYLRVKYLVLPPAYRAFIRDRLEPGGTLIISDCSFSWPVTKVSERHFFQVGGYGTTTPEEYLHGSDRVRQFLQEQGAGIEKWDAPPTDSERPEAEWGFVESLADDIATLGVPTYRIGYRSPESLSAFVADCHRWWFSRRGHEPDSLLVSCFANIDPHTALQARSVPYWLVFNTSVSADGLEQFCRERSFKQAHVTLMANGVTGIGSVSLAQWRTILSNVAGDVTFVGIDEDAYPNDPASFLFYGKDLRAKLAPLRDPPRQLQMDEFVSHIAEVAEKYPLVWRQA